MGFHAAATFFAERIQRRITLTRPSQAPEARAARKVSNNPSTTFPNSRIMPTRSSNNTRGESASTCGNFAAVMLNVSACSVAVNCCPELSSTSPVRRGTFPLRRAARASGSREGPSPRNESKPLCP